MIESIKRILDNNVLIEIKKDEHDSFLFFEEDSIESDIKKLKVTGIPDNSCAFTLDYASKNPSFTRLSPYFNASNGDGINKSCDLVILTIGKHNDKNELMVDFLVTDIKSRTVPLTTNIQLENSVLFINYIISLLNKYYQITIRPNFIKIIISTKPKKQPIVKNKQDVKFKSISKIGYKGACEIAFSRLIAG